MLTSSKYPFELLYIRTLSRAPDRVASPPPKQPRVVDVLAEWLAIHMLLPYEVKIICPEMAPAALLAKRAKPVVELAPPAWLDVFE